MTALYSILLAIDVFLAIGIIALVLLQHGKGADAGAAFGSGASATVFGARGSTSFLSRSTGILAACFFLNSLALAYLAANQPAGQSVVEKIATEAAKESPVKTEIKDVPTEESSTAQKSPAKDTGMDRERQSTRSQFEDVPVDEAPNVSDEADDKLRSQGDRAPVDVPQ